MRGSPRVRSSSSRATRAMSSSSSARAMPLSASRTTPGLSMRSRSSRPGTTLARTPSSGTRSCFKLKRDKFQDLGLNDKLQFANRKAVGAGAVPTTQAKPPSSKTDSELKLIAQAIRSNENLQTITTLDDARVQSFIDVMWKEDVAAGHQIITEGDLNADFFYVVQDGAFDVLVSEEEDGPAGDNFAAKVGDAKIVSTVTKGGSFGELALLYFVPHAATVKAKALVEMHFTKDELVIQQGEPGNTFYILYDGHVSIVKDGKEVTKLSANSQRGIAQYFGEGALMDNETRAATVQVLSETAKTLVLDRDSFNMLLGPLKDTIERSHQGNHTSMAKGKPGMPGSAPAGAHDKILRKDMQRIGLLGCGGFGTVELYEHKGSHDTYAMKGLSKGYIIKTGMQESVMNEKNILMMTNSDFVIKLWETYNGSQTLYFLLEPALGGELYATYNRKGFHGSEKHAKYYIAGTVYAFEHLHERRIIYRDLKPENLLLDCDGHVKVTDFGLSKEGIMDNISAKTMCGTPEYLAPEIVEKNGHGRGVDWYSVGALTYEMLTGLPPFYTKDRAKLFERIRSGELAYPSYITPISKNLLAGLLERDPEQRLGGGPAAGDDVKAHPFFKDIDWVKLDARSYDPPFKPQVCSDSVKYFEKEFIGQPVVNSEVGEGGKDVGHFDCFTYSGDK
mmetsp:Transcript_114840/g.365012  ORF Transcript_114840/g.365012 Transcript_114840/m.365012 type:complete len:676 (+) Transcript_114840:266-2293(+)